MPHIVVKMVAGRSEEQKQKLAGALADTLARVLGCGDDAVSVSVEDIAASDWFTKVYDPEIAGRADTLYKKPGYSRP
ncbi:tautomerase family protein [Brucella grignonensis]|nr:tautomerase family protein [Brucella grignonensis]NKB84126.1 4-oxalocrotonate tautomerase [Brucella grignonensis]